MPSISTTRLKLNNAEQFKESFYEPDATVSYVFLGNHVPYPDENSVPALIDSVSTEKEVWDNIFAAKKVTGNDVELVIPKVIWTANTKYSQYDDKVSLNDLLIANTQQNVKPMYVITSARNVYKCLSNNVSANSTIEPVGDYTTSNGNISTADGYIWKYMYNVRPSNKFLTTNWMPIPSSTDALDYGISSLGVVEGELTQIVVTNNGQNYRQASNIKAQSFSSGQTTIILSDTAAVLSTFSIPSLANLANMSISGTGITSGTYIKDISNITGVITLSTATESPGGGSSNNVTISSRVFIDGDGIGTVANVVLSNTFSGVSASAANVAKIVVTTIGRNYSYANAFVFGSGTGATARVVLPPKFGHAFSPSKELGANSVMVSMKIGEIDSTENGIFPIDTSFRQFGLLRNPYKYGSNSIVTSANANSAISQTTDLTIVAGPNYLLNEFVYQGSLSNPTAYGFVCTQSTNKIRLTKVKGNFGVGPLIGANSGTSRTVTTTANPGFKPYSGDILYVENIAKVDRADGQAENIKMTISF